MRIAFLSTLKGTPWGGSEELWVAACDRALRAGHAALISRYEWPETPPKQAALIARGAVASLRPRRAGKIARLFPRPRWLREIESFNPDVICISQGNAYECAGHRSMRPLFRWLKRSDAALVNLIQFNSEDTGLGRAAAVRARWLYERAAASAFVAWDNHRLAEKRLDVKIHRAVEVRNPVNLTDTSPIAQPTDPVIRFACVARIDARTKGQDMLLDVLGRAEWKGRAWSLDFYGAGQDQQRFADQAAKLGIADRVHFRGHFDDIRELWSHHHALLLPSRAEGTPLAMVEAMLLTRPCLVCAVGGCGDWVLDGDSGFLSPVPTTESVGAAMDRLWQARDRWPQIGEDARIRAQTLMGPDPGQAMLDVLIHAAQTRPTPFAR